MDADTGEHLFTDLLGLSVPAAWDRRTKASGRGTQCTAKRRHERESQVGRFEMLGIKRASWIFGREGAGGKDSGLD